MGRGAGARLSPRAGARRDPAATTAGSRTVLVTGASGFVGRHVVAALAAGGWRVRALVRDATRAPAEAHETRVVPELGDPAARAAIREAVSGAEVVLHLAARVHVMRETAADPMREFRRTNVDGTRMLAEAAVEAGARHLVFLSSVKAVGEHSTAPWTPATPPAPVDPYGISKLEAERAVAEVVAGSRTAASVLRLPLVYGPGVAGNMLRLFDLVARGWPVPLGGIDNRRSILYVGNLANALGALARAERDGYAIFHAADERDVSTPALLVAIARALGVRSRLLPFPGALLRPVAVVGDRLATAVPFPVTSAALRRLTGSLTVDTSALTGAIGRFATHSLEDGLGATASWYLSRRRA